jgi:colanic acid biosynthesis glycosyl transferase WcaI
MRILIYGLNFAPEPTGIGRYTGELVEWLAERGHSLRVITTPPYYPHWRIDQHYQNRYSQHSEDGTTVYRCPLWVPCKPSGINRLPHLASFAFSSLPVLLRQCSWQPEVLITIAPAFFCTPGALFISRLTGCRTLLHIQDFELDAAFQLDLLRGTWMRRLALAAERRLLQGFDRVTTISQGMVSRLLEKGVLESRCGLLPNWVNTDQIRPLNRPSSYRKRLGIPPDAIVCLYSGSMNRKQGLELLAIVARRLKSIPNLYWVFCGNGPTRQPLEQACAGLDQVRLLDLQPPSEITELLNLADIHLLPQKGAAADLVMPSKLLGMLASGVAVIATSPPGTELTNVCNETGVVVDPDDVQAFEQALMKLIELPNLRRQLGAKGRSLVEARWSHYSVLSEFEEQLKAMCNRNFSNQRS